MNKDDLYRLFRKKYVPLSPLETIDGQPDERVAVMEEFANIIFKVAGTVLVNCPDNKERDIAIRRMYDALIYADLSLMLGQYE